MDKYYIQAVDPEYFTPTNYYDENDCIQDGIWIGGNVDFQEWNTNLGNGLISAIDWLNEDLKYIFKEESDDEDYNPLEECQSTIKNFLKKYSKTVTNSQVNRLYKFLRIDKKYASLKTLENIISIIYDEPYTTKTLRGSSSGDWQMCVYPKSLEDKISYIEAVYFGTGNEYVLCPHPVNSEEEFYDAKDAFTDYCVDFYPETWLKDWAAKTLSNYGIPTPIIDPQQQIVIVE